MRLSKLPPRIFLLANRVRIEKVIISDYNAHDVILTQISTLQHHQDYQVIVRTDHAIVLFATTHINRDILSHHDRRRETFTIAQTSSIFLT